jgi:tetratricopeptide (TPR) repeat protein
MDDKTKQAIALGREHYEKREYDKAERYLSQIISDGQHAYPDIYNMMGVIHHDRGRLEEARDAFMRALDLNRSYTEAALNLAVTFNDLGLYDEAQRIYRLAIGQGTRDAAAPDPYAKGKIANLHAQVAEAYLELDMTNEAVQEYRNAIRLCPQFADLRVKLAEVYRQIGDLEAARFELTEAVRVKPGYVPARVALGMVWLLSGQRRKAIDAWEEALHIDPENKSVHLYLRTARNPPVVSELPPKPDPNETL